MMKSLSFKILLLIFVFLYDEAEPSTDRIRLRDVTALTFSRGQYTTGRRSASIPQLQCVGGSAYGKYSPKVVQCYNRGFDGIDVQWECVSEMDKNYKLGKVDVNCEGYEYPDDPYVLTGSCGLRYEVDYSYKGAKETYFKGDSFFSILPKILLILAVVGIIYLVYSSVSGPSTSGATHGGTSGGGGGGGGGGGWPGDDGSSRRPPPYGWSQPPPPYDSGSGSSHNKGPSNDNSNSGPGFWSGIGLGSLAGYLFGSGGNQNYGGYGYPYRRRNYHSYGDYGHYDEPSTSSSFFGSSGSYSSSSDTHESRSHGSTSRR